MNLANLLRSISAIVLGAAFLVPVFAMADSDIDTALQQTAAVSASANASVDTTGVKATASTTISATVVARAKTKADTEIDRRTKALTDLNARVEQMTKVSAQLKTNIVTNIQNQLTGLVQLKSKIDAETDGATLKADVQSITQSYRIFALVMPQARIAAAADREATIINMLAGIGSKLQARVQADQGAGVDVTAMISTLNDMSTHLTSAQGHAQAAINGTATLTPDNGDKTAMASNTAALKTGRDEITNGQKDLVAARKDVDTIMKALASAKVSATASSTTSVGQ
ncbi:MAG TPA: hypothetical protein VG934_00615 [Candidatus Paceibacterota bacterium]|nr:hypothetical protein [Candidatus Paceibacterota bacterium]